MKVKKDDLRIRAYNVRTREKNCPINDAVITKTTKGYYLAIGHDGKGNKLSALLLEDHALEAIRNGVAKQGW